MARKTWKAEPKATAAMQVTSNSATIAVKGASDIQGIHVDESGLYLRGKMSIMTMPEQIRVGGLWTQASGWRQMLPSTLAFPNPALILNPSVKGVTDMIQAVTWMMGMLA